MVNKFPWEVKVAEFGLARDLTRMTSRRSSRWRNPRVRVSTHTQSKLSCCADVDIVEISAFLQVVKFKLSCPTTLITKLQNV